MRRRYTGFSRRWQSRSGSKQYSNKENNPLVSILIRTRNRPSLLAEAVRSVVSQDYRPIEIVVVNDGGDDPSPLLGGIDLKGVSLQLINLPRQGRSVAANKAVEASSGKYINFLDDDDILLPQHVSTLVRVLEKQHRKVAYTACEMVEMELSSDGTWQRKPGVIKRFSTPFDEKRILFENFIPFMTLMMEREAFQKVGGIDTSFEIYEDWDLIIRLSDRYTPLHIPKVTALYRVHREGGVGDARTGDDLWRWTERIFAKHINKISSDHLTNYLRWVVGLKIATLEREKESLSGELYIAQKEIESLKKRIFSLEEENKDLLTRIGLLNDNVEALRRERDTLLSHKAAIESTLGWRLLVKVRRLRDLLLPQGSFRRVLLWDGWVGFVKDGNRREKLKRVIDLIRRSGFKGAWQQLKAHGSNLDAYRAWVETHTPSPKELRDMRRDAEKWQDPPLISVVMPVYKTPLALLEKAIESVKNQAYPFWELCIADDGSHEPALERLLSEYAKNDRRIKVKFLTRNGGISFASNAALEMATGDFVALLDHDDELPPHALYRVAKVIREKPSVDMIYSDEDKLDPKGNRCEPFFKPDWSPDLLLTQMYTCHLGVYRRSILEEIGGFRSEYDGSQDYDLVLRFTEKTQRIHHIPDILYHWRMVPGSCAGEVDAKPFAQDAGKRALEDALRRRGIKGRVLPGYSTGMYRVSYEIAEPYPKVSIVIPNRDHVRMLKQCVSSILEKTEYPSYEVVIVENGSREEATFAYYEDIAEKENKVSVLKYPEKEFNFAHINNWAVDRTKGDMVLFLNNDTEVISKEWLRAMVEHAQRPEIGAVGAKLLFPDNTIQHAGVILGIGGVANHEHMGLRDDLPGYFGRPHAIHNVSAVTAACMLIRRDLFQEMGGFDSKNLPVAFNDVDLCLRIRERGYWIVYTPYARLYHHESFSRGRDDVFSERFQKEAAYMIERWGDMLENDPFYNPNLSREEANFIVRA